MKEYEGITYPEREIIKELNFIGYEIVAVQDLYINKLNYSNAIPILIKYLPQIENSSVKEQVIRALTVKWAINTNASRILIEEFRKSKNDLHLCWVIGSALEVLAKKDIQGDIINLVEDPFYGTARQMLVLALSKMDKNYVEPVLISLLNDETVRGQAIISLGKLRSNKAKPFLEMLTNDNNSWIKRETKLALEKIGKGGAK